MIKGTTFWRKDDDSEIFHLRFIISNQDVDNKVLVVNMTKWYNTGREDSSCILKSRDHKCIKVDSWIPYNQAFEINYLSLLREKYKGLIRLEDNLTKSVLARIQSGARKSPALPFKFKKYFQNF